MTEEKKSLMWNEKYSLDTVSIRTVLRASFLLTEEDVMHAILSKQIWINGKYYHTPINKLRQVFLEGDYTKLIELDLTEVKP